MEDQPERFALEPREDLRALIDRERLEEDDAIFARQVVEKLREVRRVDRGHGGGELLGILPNELFDVGSDDLRERHASLLWHRSRRGPSAEVD